MNLTTKKHVDNYLRLNQTHVTYHKLINANYSPNLFLCSIPIDDLKVHIHISFEFTIN